MREEDKEEKYDNKKQIGPNIIFFFYKLGLEFYLKAEKKTQKTLKVAENNPPLPFKMVLGYVLSRIYLYLSSPKCSLILGKGS